MKSLNKKEIEMLRRLGAAFFNHSQCAIMLEIDVQEFRREMKDDSSPAFKAYNSGFLNKLLELREADAESAVRGSNPALQSLIKAAQDANASNI